MANFKKDKLQKYLRFPALILGKMEVISLLLQPSLPLVFPPIPRFHPSCSAHSCLSCGMVFLFCRVAANGNNRKLYHPRNLVHRQLFFHTGFHALVNFQSGFTTLFAPQNYSRASLKKHAFHANLRFLAKKAP